MASSNRYYWGGEIGEALISCADRIDGNGACGWRWIGEYHTGTCTLHNEHVRA